MEEKTKQFTSKLQFQLIEWIWNSSFWITMESALLEGANSTLGEAVMNMNDTPPGGGSGSTPVQTTPLYIYVTVSVFYGLIFVLGIVGKFNLFVY